MEITDIKKLCINASEIYYEYLKENGKGCSEIKVHSIEIIDRYEGVIKLMLSNKIFNLDEIIFRILSVNVEYDTEQIKIIEYDYDKNLLLVQPQTEFRKIFLNLNRNDLKIISDLKFLVKRTQIWYETNGENLKLPTAKSKLKDSYKQLIFFPEYEPSTNQEKAIKNIFTNPFTYIWGAPGTGKTQFVLAYSLIHYIKSGKKVAIFAPTNNALEQVLYGVLGMTERAGIENKQILRLGNPSKKFAEMYPDVCEAKGIMKKIAEIDNQIGIIKKIIEKENTLIIFKNIENAILSINKLEELKINKNLIAKEIESKNRNYKNEENKFDIKQHEINSLKHEIEKLEKSLNSFIGKIFNTSSKELHLDEKRGLFAQKSKENELHHLKIAQLQKELHILRNEYNNTSTANELIQHIKILCSTNDSAKKIVHLLNVNNYSFIQEELVYLLKTIENDITILNTIESSYSILSKIDLKNKLDELEKSKKFLKSQTTEERIKQVNVIAATLDCYIGRFADEHLYIDHIFLDEASYACMIKALTLFINNIPITFLGDHKQLPPVCELNDRDFTENLKYKDVFIWSQSAMFIEGLFEKTKNEVCNDYTNQDNFIFNYTSKTDLKETYRFGLNLSKVLNDFVYKNGFTSCNITGETIIYYINIPGSYPQPTISGTNKAQRFNKHEAEAILNLVRKYKFKEFVVLTPYNKQVYTIGDLLPEERNEHKILNVHSSQGKEWDNVIFSVVDTDRMFFVDAKNKSSKGLNLINTAVSRAKKRLFIFCDYDFWIKQDDQLIKGLLEAATEYKL